MQITSVKISQIEPNLGQIPGLPKNPRFIRDARFKNLVKSIEDDPEFLELRETILYPHPNKENIFVAICGNMRLRACKELKHKEIPAKILPVETTAQKLRAYAIKDNVAFGNDDIDELANEWDMKELEGYGMELIESESSEEKIEKEQAQNERRCETCGQIIKEKTKK
jgi:hypothetical protein